MVTLTINIYIMMMYTEVINLAVRYTQIWFFPNICVKPLPGHGHFACPHITPTDILFPAVPVYTTLWRHNDTHTALSPEQPQFWMLGLGEVMMT